MALHQYCVSLIFVFGLMASTCLAIRCLQCNMRQRGIGNTCEDPRVMQDCIGCMKTVTRVWLRDSGVMTGRERESRVISRYCMMHGANNVKPEGCYKQMNNGGYTERCFCYSDLCNEGVTLKSNLLTKVLLPLISTAVISLRYFRVCFT